MGEKITQAEVAIGLVLVGVLMYFGWKAQSALGSVGSGISTAVGDTIDAGVRGFNQVGQTVKNTTDAARLSLSDALFAAFGTEAKGLPGATPPDGSGSSSQNMYGYQSSMTPAMSDFGSYYDGWSVAPDNFTEAASRVVKPSLENLNQPPTPYVGSLDPNDFIMGTKDFTSGP